MSHLDDLWDEEGREQPVHHDSAIVPCTLSVLLEMIKCDSSLSKSSTVLHHSVDSSIVTNSRIMKVT